MGTMRNNVYPCVHISNLEIEHYYDMADLEHLCDEIAILRGGLVHKLRRERDEEQLPILLYDSQRELADHLRGIQN